MRKKKSQLVVEFASPQDLQDFLDAHQYLAQAAIKTGQTFTSASRFGAICIVKEVNALARKLSEALEKQKEETQKVEQKESVNE